MIVLTLYTLGLICILVIGGGLVIKLLISPAKQDKIFYTTPVKYLIKSILSEI